ncbi:hypothetical protein GCM10010869_18950 [Mesorhizobium tianshanense]|nr:hypothetical protein GCM10010869_18950 [Mesorhizobium tianshanense]
MTRRLLIIGGGIQGMMSASAAAKARAFSEIIVTEQALGPIGASHYSGGVHFPYGARLPYGARRARQSRRKVSNVCADPGDGIEGRLAAAERTKSPCLVANLERSGGRDHVWQHPLAIAAGQ